MADSAPTLTSPQNDKIKLIRRLQARSRNRHKEKRFVIEGVRLCEEALAAGSKPELVIFTEGLNRRGQKVVAGFEAVGAQVFQVSPEVMQAASDTETPQGVLAVLPLQTHAIPEQLDFVLIPDRVRDPGNMGTLLRTAQAAGVDAVLIPPGSVDPFSPKVVRAAMGAHFYLPVHKIAWQQINKIIKTLRLPVFLAETTDGQPCYEADFKAPLVLIIGGEASGASKQARKLAPSLVHIPMPGKAESLNAAVAGAVLMFEVVRQSVDQ